MYNPVLIRYGYDEDYAYVNKNNQDAVGGKQFGAGTLSGKSSTDPKNTITNSKSKRSQKTFFGSLAVFGAALLTLSPPAGSGYSLALGPRVILAGLVTVAEFFGREFDNLFIFSVVFSGWLSGAAWVVS